MSKLLFDFSYGLVPVRYTDVLLYLPSQTLYHPPVSFEAVIDIDRLFAYVEQYSFVLISRSAFPIFDTIVYLPVYATYDLFVPSLHLGAALASNFPISTDIIEMTYTTVLMWSPSFTTHGFTLKEAVCCAIYTAEIAHVAHDGNATYYLTHR